MKIFDVVKLVKEFNSMPIGTKGTIVLEYDGKYFEVEFFDNEGDTIDVLTTPADIIEVEIALQTLREPPMFLIEKTVPLIKSENIRMIGLLNTILIMAHIVARSLCMSIFIMMANVVPIRSS
ncbi:MAG: DUF4926 domain-containing protein [Firmicutes bacterium]|nr:DUF4926 domain-containing protein [Bacillota bacterium]